MEAEQDKVLIQSCSCGEGTAKPFSHLQNECLQKHTLKYKRILGFYSNKNSECNQCEIERVGDSLLLFL